MVWQYHAVTTSQKTNKRDRTQHLVRPWQRKWLTWTSPWSTKSVFCYLKYSQNFWISWHLDIVVLSWPDCFLFLNWFRWYIDVRRGGNDEVWSSQNYHAHEICKMYNSQRVNQVEIYTNSNVKTAHELQGERKNYIVKHSNCSVPSNAE